jgi:hypothetical protein
MEPQVVTQAVSQTEVWTAIFELIRYLVPIALVVLIVGAILWKLVIYGIDLFVKKFTKVVSNADAYITLTQLEDKCKVCQKRREDSMDKHAQDSQQILEDFKKDVLCEFKKNAELFGDIRQIVLVTALKAGVHPEDLSKLTNIPKTLFKNL